MSSTKDQLIARLLSDLNVVGSGQTAQPEDKEYVSGVVTTTCAELSARDIATITPDDDDIDDSIYEPLVEYLVGKLGPGYGKPPMSSQDFLLIETRMKDITRPDAPKPLLETETILRQGAWPRGLRTQW